MAKVRSSIRYSAGIAVMILLVAVVLFAASAGALAVNRDGAAFAAGADDATGREYTYKSIEVKNIVLKKASSTEGSRDSENNVRYYVGGKLLPDGSVSFKKKGASISPFQIEFVLTFGYVTQNEVGGSVDDEYECAFSVDFPSTTGIHKVSLTGAPMTGFDSKGNDINYDFNAADKKAGWYQFTENAEISYKLNKTAIENAVKNSLVDPAGTFNWGDCSATGENVGVEFHREGPHVVDKEVNPAYFHLLLYKEHKANFSNIPDNFGINEENRTYKGQSAGDDFRDVIGINGSVAEGEKYFFSAIDNGVFDSTMAETAFVDWYENEAPSGSQENWVLIDRNGGIQKTGKYRIRLNSKYTNEYFPDVSVLRFLDSGANDATFEKDFEIEKRALNLDIANENAINIHYSKTYDGGYDAKNLFANVTDAETFTSGVWTEMNGVGSDYDNADACLKVKDAIASGLFDFTDSRFDDKNIGNNKTVYIKTVFKENSSVEKYLGNYEIVLKKDGNILEEGTGPYAGLYNSGENYAINPHSVGVNLDNGLFNDRFPGGGVVYGSDAWYATMSEYDFPQYVKNVGPKSSRVRPFNPASTFEEAYDGSWKVAVATSAERNESYNMVYIIPRLGVKVAATDDGDYEDGGRYRTVEKDSTLYASQYYLYYGVLVWPKTSTSCSNAGHTYEPAAGATPAENYFSVKDGDAVILKINVGVAVSFAITPKPLTVTVAGLDPNKTYDGTRFLRNRENMEFSCEEGDKGKEGALLTVDKLTLANCKAEYKFPGASDAAVIEYTIGFAMSDPEAVTNSPAINSYEIKKKILPKNNPGDSEELAPETGKISRRELPVYFAETSYTKNYGDKLTAVIRAEAPCAPDPVIRYWYKFGGGYGYSADPEETFGGSKYLFVKIAFDQSQFISGEGYSWNGSEFRENFTYGKTTSNEENDWLPTYIDVSSIVDFGEINESASSGSYTLGLKDEYLLPNYKVVEATDGKPIKATLDILKLPIESGHIEVTIPAGTGNDKLIYNGTSREFDVISMISYEQHPEKNKIDPGAITVAVTAFALNSKRAPAAGDFPADVLDVIRAGRYRVEVNFPCTDNYLGFTVKILKDARPVFDVNDPRQGDNECWFEFEIAPKPVRVHLTYPVVTYSEDIAEADPYGLKAAYNGAESCPASPVFINEGSGSGYKVHVTPHGDFADSGQEIYACYTLEDGEKVYNKERRILYEGILLADRNDPDFVGAKIVTNFDNNIAGTRSDAISFKKDSAKKKNYDFIYDGGPDLFLYVLKKKLEITAPPSQEAYFKGIQLTPEYTISGGSGKLSVTVIPKGDVEYSLLVPWGVLSEGCETSGYYVCDNGKYISADGSADGEKEYFKLIPAGILPSTYFPKSFCTSLNNVGDSYEIVGENVLLPVADTEYYSVISHGAYDSVANALSGSDYYYGDASTGTMTYRKGNGVFRPGTEYFKILYVGELPENLPFPTKYCVSAGSGAPPYIAVPDSLLLSGEYKLRVSAIPDNSKDKYASINYEPSAPAIVEFTVKKTVLTQTLEEGETFKETRQYSGYPYRIGSFDSYITGEKNGQNVSVNDDWGSVVITKISYVDSEEVVPEATDAGNYLIEAKATLRTEVTSSGIIYGENAGFGPDCGTTEIVFKIELRIIPSSEYTFTVRSPDVESVRDRYTPVPDEATVPVSGESYYKKRSDRTFVLDFTYTGGPAPSDFPTGFYIRGAEAEYFGAEASFDYQLTMPKEGVAPLNVVAAVNGYLYRLNDTVYITEEDWRRNNTYYIKNPDRTYEAAPASADGPVPDTNYYKIYFIPAPVQNDWGSVAYYTYDDGEYVPASADGPVPGTDYYKRRCIFLGKLSYLPANFSVEGASDISVDISHRPKMKDAGEYAIKYYVNYKVAAGEAELLPNPNYASRTVEVIFAVNPRRLEVGLILPDGFDCPTKKYGDANPEFDSGYCGGPTEEDVTKKYNFKYCGWVPGEEGEIEDPPTLILPDADEKVGIWPILSEGGSPPGNYRFEHFNGVLRIERAQLEVFVDETTKYNGRANRKPTVARRVKRGDSYVDVTEPAETKINLIGLYTGENPPENGKIDRDAYPVDNQARSKDAGKYIFTISIRESTNYKAVPEEYYCFEITKAELEVRFVSEDGEKIYDKKTEYPEFFVRYSGFLEVDAENIYENNAYSVCHSDSSAESARIFDLDLFHPRYMIYNIEDPDKRAVTPLNVGTYGIKVFIGEKFGKKYGVAKNYELFFDESVPSPKLEITPRPVGVEKASPVKKIYDGTKSCKKDGISGLNYNFVSVDGTPESGVVGDDEVRLLFYATEDGIIPDAFDRVNVLDEEGKSSDVKVTLTSCGTDNDNYYLHGGETVCLKGQIAPADPEINLYYSEKSEENAVGNIFTVTYNGTSHKIVPEVLGVTLSDGKEIITEYEENYTCEEPEYDSDNPPSSAGDYKYTLTVKNPNYKETFKILTLKILKADVVIEFDGDNVGAYDSMSPAPLKARARGELETDWREASVYYYAVIREFVPVAEFTRGTEYFKLVPVGKLLSKSFPEAYCVRGFVPAFAYAEGDEPPKDFPEAYFIAAPNGSGFVPAEGDFPAVGTKYFKEGYIDVSASSSPDPDEEYYLAVSVGRYGYVPFAGDGYYACGVFYDGKGNISEGGAVASISDADAGAYVAEAVSEATPNYNELRKRTIYTVKRKEVNAEFSPVSDYPYTGKSVGIKAYFENKEETVVPALLFDVKENGEYVPYNYGSATNGYPVSVGEYRVRIADSERNFEIINQSWHEFNIVPVSIKIKVADLKTRETYPIYPRIEIVSGLMPDDSPDAVFFEEPTFEYYDATSARNKIEPFPTLPGEYIVVAVGGKARNYRVSESISGRLTVSKSSVEFALSPDSSESETVTVKGSFSAEAEISVKEEKSDYTHYVVALESFKENNPDFMGYHADKIYAFEVVKGSVNADDSITIRLPAKEFFASAEESAEEFFVARVSSADGSVEIIPAIRDGDFLEFTAPSLDVFVLLSAAEPETEKNNDWIIYLCTALALGMSSIAVALVIIKKKA